MKRLKTIALLLAVFVAGLLIGGVVTVRIIQRQHRERMNSATWTPRTMAWLESTLQLSPEEASKIRPLVVRSMEKMAELRGRVDRERKQLFGEMFAEIAPQLTDEQRRQLQEAVRVAAAQDPSFGLREDRGGKP